MKKRVASSVWTVNWRVDPTTTTAATFEPAATPEVHETQIHRLVHASDNLWLWQGCAHRRKLQFKGD